MNRETCPTGLATLHHAARILLGLLFVAAGVVKLTGLAEFRRHLADFGIVADPLVPLVALLVCVAELVAGTALILRVRGSLAVIVSLLVIFLLVLIYGIALGLDIECGCFGPVFHVSLRTQLLLDLGVLGGCWFVYWSGRKCSTRPLNLLALLHKNRCREPAAPGNDCGERL